MIAQECYLEDFTNGDIAMTPYKGPLKVFISSTFRDLKEERLQIIEKIDQSLFPIGMEFFSPDGSTSQEKALFDIDQGLIKSDIVIFLISPVYGSLVEQCPHKGICKASCPQKNNPPESISYTHCEYKFAKAESKQCLVYLIDEKGWNAVQHLHQMNDLDWKSIRTEEAFQGLSNNQIESMFKERNQLLKFKREIQSEFVPIIESNTLYKITENLSNVIVKWYFEGKIDLKDFCGRRSELKDLIEKLDESVEVYGVGGIGKTTLIQIALLLQKLKGRKIVSIGKKQSYLSGSGYSYFKDKCRNDIYEITTNLITINDIIEALNVRSLLKLETVEEKIQILIKQINTEKLLVFIDDFHLADANVKNLVQHSNGFIVASKSNTGITHKQLALSGIEIDERQKLIEMVATYFDKRISQESIDKIIKISEGHPITIELLVRNIDKIDFKNIENLKKCLIFSNPQHVDEFINRVIKDILSENAYLTIKKISVINTDIENNLNKKTLIKTLTYGDNISIITELIDTGLISKKENIEGAYQFTFKHIQEALQEQDRNFHHFAINYYKNKFTWVSKSVDDEVELLYHKILFDPTSNYTSIFGKISNHIEPINYNFKRFISIGKHIKNQVPLKEKSQISNILGNLFMIMHRYKEAKDEYFSYLSIIDALPRKNIFEYMAYKRDGLTNLGNVYIEINKYDESEKIYLDGLELCEKLIKKYPNNLEEKTVFVQLLQNLGNVQKQLDKFSEAETSYKRSIEISREIAKRGKILYSEEIAGGLNNLGGLYYNLGRYQDAEKLLRESLNIISHLIPKNPAKFEPQYYKICSNLGRVYLQQENFIDAEAELTKAYEKFKEYFEINPDAFCPDIVRNLDALVSLYMSKYQIKTAEYYAKDSERIIEYLVQRCSRAYLPTQAKIYADLGNIYSILNQSKKSEDYLTKSQSIIDTIPPKYLDYYLTDSLLIHNILGAVYLKLHRYKDTEKQWIESLKIVIKLMNLNEEAYQPYFNVVLNNLGQYYLLIKRYDISEKLLIDCLRRRRIIAYNCPAGTLGDLTHPLNALGNLYAESSIEHDPANYFRESINICEMLISSQKAIYKINYAHAYQNFGNYYLSIKKYDDANEKLSKALDIWKELIEIDRLLFLEDYIETIQKKSELLIAIEETPHAEVNLIKSLEYCQELLAINQEIFNPLYADLLNLLGKAYTITSKYSEAEDALNKALFIQKLYFDKEYMVFGNRLILTLTNIKSLNSTLGKTDNVIKCDKEIDEINRKIQSERSRSVPLIGDYIMFLENARNDGCKTPGPDIL